MLIAMSSQEPSPLSQEWLALFKQHEQYEFNALLVKLLATVLYAVGVAASQDVILISVIVLSLWLQESMQRTMQARVGHRIALVEDLLARGQPDPAQAFQLHTQWLASRKGIGGLLSEYGINACRPTVAFPYAVFLLHMVYLLSLVPTI